ncbi:MAG TPA: hypoxanthine phosphoribosyltransferase, partial [Thermodesulfobacteriota bacterium]|nr:hypoxanthine phosphoribosyltransferase [Thermodesulfobacteriota bacterium]
MKLLIGEEEIRKRVEELARRISRDFSGKEIILVGVLKGAFMFLADLARRITVPVKIDFIRLRTYGSGTEPGEKVKITKDVEMTVKGEHVLLVEDIVDTGITMEYLRRRLRKRRPGSLKTVALLDKPARRRVKFEPDYLGFTIP